MIEKHLHDTVEDRIIIRLEVGPCNIVFLDLAVVYMGLFEFKFPVQLNDPSLKMCASVPFHFTLPC